MKDTNTNMRIHKKNPFLLLKEKSSILYNQFLQKMDEVFLSKKKTFIFLALFVFTFLFGTQILIILVNNSFYTNYSDDILQYYTIIVDFIRQVKEGSISFFNLNNYLGASFFSDVYYVPLDIFTFITFLFSYGMPTQLAYSVTELVKIFSGVMVFAYYLSLQGMKNRTIFWMGIFYFISGGTVSFMAFPAFLSLVFYLPLALLVIHWSLNGKKWIVPLFALALVFYDFYLAYMVLIFTGIMFVVEYIKRPNFKIYRFVKDGIVFLLLLFLGLGMSLIILYPSILFILQDTFRDTGTFPGWVINIGSFELKLFEPKIYIRFLAKMFAEQRPIGFYGFARDYTKEHVSLYITMTGLITMFYVYFMKDRISKIYKVLIPISVLLMFFPLFSFVFSGTTDQPYTRWINVYPLVQVMILAHVFDKHGFEGMKMKWLTIPIVLLLALVGFVMYYYISKLIEFQDFQYEDVLTWDTILMGISALALVVLLIFGWVKRPQWFKYVFWIEFGISFCFIYSGPFSIPNKNDTFESMYAIDDFLTESIDEKEFFRVYVDLDRFNVEKINFNRMTTYPTNTKIFHSWTDKETDALAKLLFNEVEHQSKSALEVQAIYLNQFLGYKYVLASTDYTYYLDSDLYQLKNANDEYQLLEIVNARPFQVYESYATDEAFTYYRRLNNKIEGQKILLADAIIESERFETETLNLLQKTLIGTSGLLTIDATQKASLFETVLIPGISDSTVREFYKFSGDAINFGINAGALYIKTQPLFGEIMLEFSDNTKRACGLKGEEVHCEFWAEPMAIYFEAENLSTAFNFNYRLELARNQAAYLVYDLSEIAYSRDQGMLYFELTQPFERVFFVDANGNEYEGFKNYYYFDTRPIRMYVFKTYDMYTKVNDLSVFNLKYAYDDLSTYEQSVGVSLFDQESLIIKNGKINLQYHRTSDSEYDQLVVIPTAYSEEWVFTTNQKFETISASGGFLSFIVPNGVEYIDVELKFVPKGLLHGTLASLGSSLVYLGIFLPGWIKKRKQNRQSDKELTV